MLLFLNEAKMVVCFLRMQQLVDMQPVFLILSLVVVNLRAGGCVPMAHRKLETLYPQLIYICSAQANGTKTATSDSYFQQGFGALGAGCD